MKHKGLGYCYRHYLKYKTYGDPLARGKKDPNEIIVDGDRALICLYKDREVVAHAIIDSEDIELVQGCVWYLDTDGYVKSNTKDKRKLHRLITCCPAGKVVDHYNHNKLDNTKENLIVCTHLENNQNIAMRKDNTSGARGVCYRKDNDKWRATIHVNNETINLGSYDSYVVAVRKRIEAENKYFNQKGDVQL